MLEAIEGKRLARVEEMLKALMENDRKAFLPYFSRELFYKVGAAEPVRGPEACWDVLAGIYTKLKPTAHDVRGTWEIGNVVIVEMDANYVALDEGRPVKVPCCDVYRFEGDLIKEWRVYPDASRTGIQLGGATS
jgi:ketosteroid isomerase-like protein